MDTRTSEVQPYLESIVGRVAKELISTYLQSRAAKDYGLVFPRKRDGSLRISEQEPKLLFLEQIRADKEFCYSVETPTTQTYRQKGMSDMSARVDLTLGRAGQPHVNVEFKANYCGIESIRKDLEKLLREDLTGVWFHTLEGGNRVRMESLLRDFRTAFGQVSAYLGRSSRSYLISICSLDTGVLYWTWLTLAGNLELNLAAIDDVFQIHSLISGSWSTTHFGSNTPKDESDAARMNLDFEASRTGRGAREGFFVLIPSIAKDTYMHLSSRGDSYRIRNFYRTRSAKTADFRIPGYATFQSLRDSGLIAEWLSVTADDARHNLIEQPGYWYERIRQINQQALQTSDGSDLRLTDSR